MIPTMRQRIEASRLEQMQQLGFWVAGPISAILVLQSIITDFKLYPEQAGPLWVVLRLMIIPLSIVSMILLKSANTKRYADLVIFAVASYIAAFHAYFLSQTGFGDSKYFHSYIQILIGVAILPMRQVTFLITIASVLAIYVGTILAGGASLGFLLVGDAMFLKTYLLMTILLFYSFRYARTATYKAKIELQDELENRVKEIERLVKDEVLIKQAHTRIEISKQVSHDIRSPLSALNMLLRSTSGIPEEHRLILRNATQRINDIANQLLGCARVSSSASTSPTSVELLASIVDLLISEKRTQFRDRPDIHIDADLTSSYGAFVRINARELKRALSNLINNSVEAFENEKGQVDVSVTANAAQVCLTVKDNGKGIPPHILRRLGKEPGVTYGKPGKGNGLGIHHAQTTVQGVDGTFAIDSEPGRGTSVTMTFPKTPEPPWFFGALRLRSGSRVVCIDDDISVYRIWQSRLDRWASEEIKVSHVSSECSLTQWMTSQSDAALKNAFFLVDYELLGQARTGLDLIEKYGLNDRSVLVTSHFEDPEIRAKCERLGVRLIPKGMASLVPIEVARTAIGAAPPSVVVALSSQH